LWVTRGENCWLTIEWLAERGILAAPGSFYGTAGDQYVRVAMTATDERIGRVAERLS
jgi:aspartate/methionine/tyrosine aminotransferase